MKSRECLFCGTPFTPPEDDSKALLCSEVCIKEADMALAAFAFFIQQPMTVGLFAELLADPLCGHWMPQVIWRQGEQEFMICEDFTYANIASEQIYLTAEPISAIRTFSDHWREVLQDYNRIPLDFRAAAAMRFSKMCYPLLLQIGVGAEDVEIRQAVADNPHLPMELLETLATDKHRYVRMAIARWGIHHTQVPLEDLHTLMIKYAAIENHLQRYQQIVVQLAQDQALYEVIAKNQYTPPVILAELAQHPDKEVRHAVANNPNTSYVTLMTLVVDSIPIVRSHARAALHKHGMVGIDTMKPHNCLFCGTSFTPPEDDSKALLCSEVCVRHTHTAAQAFNFLIQQPVPAAIFRGWSRDRLLREWLRQMIWRQGDLEFMVCEDYTFADVNSRQMYLTDEAIQVIYPLPDVWRNVFYEYKMLPLPVHSGGFAFFKELRYLPLLQAGVFSDHLAVRYAILANSFTPVEILALLAQDRTWEVRKAVAEHPRITAETLTQLAHDPEWQVRSAVAGWGWAVPPLSICYTRQIPTLSAPHINRTIRETPRIFAALLAELANDPEKAVRDRVAANAYNFPETYTMLAQDTEPTVRVTLALNPSTPAAVLRMLAEDTLDWVRFTVASNRHTPLATLQCLQQDTVEHIRHAAAYSIEMWQKKDQAHG